MHGWTKRPIIRNQSGLPAPLTGKAQNKHAQFLSNQIDCYSSRKSAKVEWRSLSCKKHYCLKSESDDRRTGDGSFS